MHSSQLIEPKILNFPGPNRCTGFYGFESLDGSGFKGTAPRNTLKQDISPSLNTYSCSEAVIVQKKKQPPNQKIYSPVSNIFRLSVCLHFFRCPSCKHCAAANARFDQVHAKLSSFWLCGIAMHTVTPT